MQAAGDLVSAPAELAAGVEDRVHDFEGILPGRVLADGHASAVIAHDDHAVRLDGDVDGGGMTRHRLIDRVVDDLPDEVMQAALIGRADVHARAASDRLEALEDLDACGGVVAACAPSLRAPV